MKRGNFRYIIFLRRRIRRLCYSQLNQLDEKYSKGFNWFSPAYNSLSLRPEAIYDPHNTAEINDRKYILILSNRRQLLLLFNPNIDNYYTTKTRRVYNKAQFQLQA